MSTLHLRTADDADILAFARRRNRSQADEWWYAQLGARAAGRAMLALDGDAPVGIAFGVATGDEMLCECFVEASRRNEGIGGMLLRTLSAEAFKAATLGAADAASLAFASTAGYAAHTPIMAWSGALPHDDRLLGIALGSYRLEAHPLDPLAYASVLTELDISVRGAALGSLHELKAQAAQGTLFSLNDEYVGYGYVDASGRIGPVVFSAAAYGEQILAFLFARLTQATGATFVRLHAPSANVAVARVAAACKLEANAVLLRAAMRNFPAPERYVACSALFL